jgi:hypothetical protein
VLLPAGHERFATVVPAWVRGTGAGPAAEALARMIAARGVPVPAVLSDPVTSPRQRPARDGSAPVGRDGDRRVFAWSDLVESPPAPAARSSRLAAAWSDRPVVSAPAFGSRS